MVVFLRVASKLIHAAAVLPLASVVQGKVVAQPGCDVLKVAMEHFAERFALYNTKGMKPFIWGLVT